MGIIYWNIFGVILLVSIVIFISKFYRNHNVIEKYKNDDVKLDVKIVKNETSDFNYNSEHHNNQKENTKPSTNKDVLKELAFVKLQSVNILTDPRLKYLGDSMDGGTIYAILIEDIKYLGPNKYHKLNDCFIDGVDYTKPNHINRLISIIKKQKSESGYA